MRRSGKNLSLELTRSMPRRSSERKRSLRTPSKRPGRQRHRPKGHSCGRMPSSTSSGESSPCSRQQPRNLSREFPSVRIRTESSSVGSKTSLQGHHVAISCIVADDRPREEPDLVDLLVGIRHLTTEPELESLYVCWGHPSGYVELELLDRPVPLDDAAWSSAEAAVPRLVEALRSAIKRGRPAEGAPSAFPC